jgi:hypothetical protein
VAAIESAEASLLNHTQKDGHPIWMTVLYFS